MVVSKVRKNIECFKIDNILDKGLRSKIFWTIFLNPSNKNQVSKVIYGKTDGRNGTVGRYIEDLAELDFLRRENQQFSVKTEKIVDVIEEYLVKNGIFLLREEKEILFHLLESKIVRGYFRLMTSKFVQNGNTKAGGFLADLFTRIAIRAMMTTDQTKLEKKKSDLEKGDELSNKFYTADTVKKMVMELDIQYFKKLNYFSNKEKFKTDLGMDAAYLIFHINCIKTVFELIPIELLEKLKFLNYLAAVFDSQITDGGRQFYFHVDDKWEKFNLYRWN